MKTTTVAGRVHLRDRPITDGWVEIVPVSGTVGVLRSAKLGADGRFAAEKVPVGEVAIRMAGFRYEPSGDRGLDNFLFMCGRQPLIRKAIKPGIPIDINLRDEALAFERLYGPRR